MSEKVGTVRENRTKVDVMIKKIDQQGKAVGRWQHIGQLARKVQRDLRQKRQTRLSND